MGRPQDTRDTVCERKVPALIALSEEPAIKLGEFYQRADQLLQDE